MDSVCVYVCVDKEREPIQENLLAPRGPDLNVICKHWTLEKGDVFGLSLIRLTFKNTEAAAVLLKGGFCLQSPKSDYNIDILRKIK